MKLLPARFFRRRRDSHKGDYGHVLVVGGSVGMTGAPILCAMAALRSGSGLVSLAVPGSVYPIIARKAPPEIMVHPLPALNSLLRKATVLAVGPGLSRGPTALSREPAARRLAHRLIRRVCVPVVLDADGLNAFAGSARRRLARAKGTLVLTPHPGEMARLLGTTTAAVQRARGDIACRVSKELKAVVVLKGRRTIVASPKGERFVNTAGNPGMATGGTGDVLTGVIAALIGQGLDPFAAARAGVAVHGLAGDLAARRVGQVSLTAGDLLAALPEAFQKLSARR